MTMIVGRISQRLRWYRCRLSLLQLTSGRGGNALVAALALHTDHQDHDVPITCASVDSVRAQSAWGCCALAIAVFAASLCSAVLFGSFSTFSAAFRSRAAALLALATMSSISLSMSRAQCRRRPTLPAGPSTISALSRRKLYSQLLLFIPPSFEKI